MTSLTFSVLLIASMFVGITAVPMANLMQSAFTPTLPGPMEQYRPFFEGADQPNLGGTSKLANFEKNLHSYLQTGVIPEGVVKTPHGMSIMLGAGYQVDLAALSEHMKINHVMDMGIGYMVLGAVNSPYHLRHIDALDYTGLIMADEFLHAPDMTNIDPGPSVDNFMVREIIQADMANNAGYDGAGSVIGVVDTGIDHTLSDLATAYHTNSSGYPTAFDPGGMGIAITDWSGSPVSGYLLTGGNDFAMVWSYYPYGGLIRYSNSTYDVLADNFWVGVGMNQIPSLSGTYKVGVCLMSSDPGGPRTRQFVFFMLTDPNSAGVYDTMYIDWETSLAVSADYNHWATPPLPADWDFTNNIINGKYDFDPGTPEPFLMAYDSDGDGYNDFGLGLLANTYDLFGFITGEMVSGIDPAGDGFAYFYDDGSHGTSVAGAAAGRGVQPLDVYGNGTDYYLTGVAPAAELMGLKLFSFGSEFECWAWGAGWRPVTKDLPTGTYQDWAHTIYMGGWDDSNQAHIITNSWGYILWEFGDDDYVYSVDWASFALDYFSTGCLGYPYHNATGSYLSNPNFPDGAVADSPLFVFSSGNAGPGYSTAGSPVSASCLTVGASTTHHYAEQIYNPDLEFGPQGYDQMAFYSSNGPTPTALPKPDVVAPGLSGFEVTPLWRARTLGTEPFRTFGGTSMAAPITAGVAALVYEAMVANGYPVVGDYPLPPNPYGFDGGLIKTIIKSTTDDIGHAVLRQGSGRVNAYKAVAMADGNETLTPAGTDYLIQLWCNNTFINYAQAYQTNMTAVNIWKHNATAAILREGNVPAYDIAGFPGAWFWVMMSGYDAPYTPSASYWHPGAHGLWAPNVSMMDAGFMAHNLYAGDTRDVGFIAATGGGTPIAGTVDAEWYELVGEESTSFFSTAPATAFPLFGSYPGINNFDAAFAADFLAADYAVITLQYDAQTFKDLWDFTHEYFYGGDTNYCFLFDWNDTNSDGVLDYETSEIRRIDSDQSSSPLLQLHVANPGAQWMGNKNATIYWRDRGIETFNYRQLEVTVNVRLYNRVDWDWFSFTQEADPLMWTAGISVPAQQTPGFYVGWITITEGTAKEYFPVLLRVDGAVIPGESLSWGGSDGHPYDNGAITGGVRWDGDGNYISGDWRHYFVDIKDPTDDTGWYMVNVTWMDPDTILDVFIKAADFGNDYWVGYWGGDTMTDTEYLRDEGLGRWDSTPSWDRQNVLLADYSLATSWYLGREAPILISIHVAERGSMYAVENFTVTVTPTNFTTTPYSAALGALGVPIDPVPFPIGNLSLLNTGEEITDDWAGTGEHLTINGTWWPWTFPGLPVPHRQTDLQVLLGATYDVYGSFTELNATPDAPPPRDFEFTIPDISTGMLIVIDFEAGPPVGAGVSPEHDCDLFLYFGEAQVASSTNAGSDEYIEYTATVAGTYTLVVDYWGIDEAPYYIWGGWDSLPWHFTAKASQILSNPIPGRTALYDTHDLGINLAGFDVTLKLVTGTSLDFGSWLTYQVSNLSVTNFFAPTVSLLNPIAGDVRGPEPFWFNWTASDQNSDETLSFQVQVSNDDGLNWTVVVPATQDMAAMWDPSGFYAVNATDTMRWRVICTDGMHEVTATSGTFELLPPPPEVPPPPYELYVVIAVIVIVIIILLTTCFLKRRQVAKT
jgi:subtilisin family serine protease